MSFNATTWIRQLGFLTNFGLYSAALAASALALPFMYIYGKGIRAWTSGRLEPRIVKDFEDDDRDWVVEKDDRVMHWQNEKMGIAF
jgi:hypothetical protein